MEAGVPASVRGIYAVSLRMPSAQEAPTAPFYSQPGCHLLREVLLLFPPQCTPSLPLNAQVSTCWLTEQ